MLIPGREQVRRATEQVSGQLNLEPVCVHEPFRANWVMCFEGSANAFHEHLERLDEFCVDANRTTRKVLRRMPDKTMDDSSLPCM